MAIGLANPCERISMQRQTPYNTGKVLIGSMYEMPHPDATFEEIWIQSVLLGDPQYNETFVWSCISSVIIALLVFVMNVYT